MALTAWSETAKQSEMHKLFISCKQSCWKNFVRTFDDTRDSSFFMASFFNLQE